MHYTILLSHTLLYLYRSYSISLCHKLSCPIFLYPIISYPCLSYHIISFLNLIMSYFTIYYNTTTRNILLHFYALLVTNKISLHKSFDMISPISQAYIDPRSLPSKRSARPNKKSARFLLRVRDAVWVPEQLQYVIITLKIKF